MKTTIKQVILLLLLGLTFQPRLSAQKVLHRSFSKIIKKEYVKHESDSKMYKMCWQFTASLLDKEHMLNDSTFWTDRRPIIVLRQGQEQAKIYSLEELKVASIPFKKIGSIQISQRAEDLAPFGSRALVVITIQRKE